MALTPEQIGLISRPYGESSIQGFDHILAFARAIEAEVRKEYTALIRQMDAALDASEAFLLSTGFESSDAFQEVSAALTAASARLEGKP